MVGLQAQLSPVTYRVSKDGELAAITVHLGSMKTYHVPSSSHAPDLDALDDLFLGTKLTAPDLEGSIFQVLSGSRLL